MSHHAAAVGDEHDNNDFLHHDESSFYPPILGTALGGFLLGSALIFGGFSVSKVIFLIAVAVVAVSSALWWWKMVQENKTPQVTLVGTPDEAYRGLKLGFAFFIASEAMFFAAFFAYYFYARFQVGTWPPSGMEMVHWWPLPAINTALLVTSSYTFSLAHHDMLKGKNNGVIAWLGVTIALGLVFLGVQAYEWSHSPFALGDGILGPSFFVLTGFHGLHVIIGTLFLIVMFFRSILKHFTPERHFAFEACGIYWHFVDVVWIGLFIVLYLM